MKWHKNIANVDEGILPKTEDCDKGVTLYAGPSHIWVDKVCAPYKGPINLHSFRLFCSGVPVSTIRRNVLTLFMAFDNAVSSFFNIWPSSQTTRSGPENGYNYKYNRTITKVTIPSQYHTYSCRARLKCDGTRTETRFGLSGKRMSPFKSAGESVQSTTGSRGVHISSSNGSNAGYTMFWGTVKDYWLPIPLARFPFTSPPVHHCVPSGFNWALPCTFAHFLSATSV